MSTQGDSFAADVTPLAVELIVLTCAFGEPWMGPHPLCEAHARDMEAEFWKDVAAGKYDPQGYTPNERKAQRKQSAR